MFSWGLVCNFRKAIIKPLEKANFDESESPKKALYLKKFKSKCPSQFFLTCQLHILIFFYLILSDLGGDYWQLSYDFRHTI